MLLNLPWTRKYTKAFELGFQTAMEYRLNFLISLISVAYPIFIQTFLWIAIYSNSGSADAVVYGYTFRQMIAYTFLAGLVSRIVRTGFEYEVMDDIKNGKYSKFLVQPLGYFPYRLCSYFGNKAPNLAIIMVLLVIVLLGLNAFWGVTLAPLRVLAFLGTIPLAVALNFMIFYCISSIAFWIVEIGFLFEGFRIVTVLISGGIFPLEVFGARFVQVMNLLPFKYTVSYPINVLTGKVSTQEMLWGLLMQVVWIAITWALANLLWREGGKRYIAVGG